MTGLIASLAGHGNRQVPLSLIGWIGKWIAFERAFYNALFDPYRPEQHYMRGPGPACAAKAAHRTQS
jgi:hypothetical protein